MKHLPHFTISGDSPPGEGSIARVTGSELHHLRNVMRLGAGSEVVLCAADGQHYAARITAFEPNAAMIAVGKPCVKDESSGAPRLILAAGIIKAARMDLLIEKAVELNAAEFWPLKCARSVVHEPSSARQQRWRRIALAAAKQCLRSRPMEIHDPLEVTAMAASIGSVPALLCKAGAEPLSAVLRRMADSTVGSPKVLVFAIGPEGDFTTEELEAMSWAGFAAAGLGATRLRTETAALAALSIAGTIFAELSSITSSA